MGKNKLPFVVLNIRQYLVFSKCDTGNLSCANAETVSKSVLLVLLFFCYFTKSIFLVATNVPACKR
jgi:hypothetical protein